MHVFCDTLHVHSYFAYKYFAIHQQCIGAQVHIPRPTICASCLLSAQPPLTEHII